MGQDDIRRQLGLPHHPGQQQSTTASEYVGLNPADVMLSNIDDESAGFVVSSVSGSVTEEGGEAVFTVRLTSVLLPGT